MSEERKKKKVKEENADEEENDNEAKEENAGEGGDLQKKGRKIYLRAGSTIYRVSPPLYVFLCINKPECLHHINRFFQVPFLSF